MRDQEPTIRSRELGEGLRRAMTAAGFHGSVRVVPASAGAHAATAGSFRLMEFDSIKPIAHVDSETSCLFLELPVEIEAYQSILAALDATALPAGQSRDFIAELAIELYGDGDDELAEEQF